MSNSSQKEIPLPPPLPASDEQKEETFSQKQPQKQPQDPPQKHPIPKTIEKVLLETARELRREEILRPTLQLAAGTLVFFWLCVLTEHWFWNGGLPTALRVLLWFGGVGTWIWIFWKRILPFLRWKINPLHVASVIETSQPGLKNGLLNLLSLAGDENFRSAQTSLERRVLRILERQTAANLASVQPEKTVSRTSTRRLTLAVGCVALCFLMYGILSPKSTLRSVGRTLFPWCDISVPTRVRILRISPQNAVVYEGEKLKISAKITHLRPDETPILYYTSYDKKFVNAPLPMNEESNSENGTNFWSVNLDENGAGMQQNLTWKIAAGDAVSPTFSVSVLPPLAVRVEEITLAPPSYTNLPVVRQKSGDLRGLEGSRVSIKVETSEAAKHVKMSVTQRRTNRTKNISMSPDIQNGNPSSTRFHAAIPFTNAFFGTSENFERKELYFARFIFENQTGVENSKPLVYMWEIQSDAAPEIQITSGPEDGTGVKMTQSAEVTFEASDSDFGLRAAAFCATWKGKRLHIPPILNLPEGAEGLKTPFVGTFSFVPADWGLQEGDEILWWIEAADTCKPTANRCATDARTLCVSDETETVNSENSEDLDENAAENPDESASENADGASNDTAFPVSADFPEVKENPLKSGAESFMEDAKMSGETLENEEPEPQKTSENESKTEEEKESERASESASEKEGADSKNESKESNENKRKNETKNKEDAQGESGAGNSSESSGKSTDGQKSTDSQKSADGQKSQSGSESEQNSEQNSERNSDQNSGTNGEKNSDAPRTSEPKLAPEGFDPLSEKEAQKEPEKADDSAKAGEKGDKKQNTNNQKSNNEEKSSQNGSKPNQDGSNSNQEGSKPNQDGSNSKQEGSKPNQDGSNSKQEGSKPNQNGENSEDGENNSGVTDSSQKADGQKGRDDAGRSELSAEAEDSDEKNEEEKSDPKKNRKGKSSGSGAKTDSEVPEDATNAQSGVQDGSDSAQNLPDPVTQRENSDGTGLQDSNYEGSEKEKMDADELKNPEDASGMENPDETRLADENESQDAQGTQPDPVSDPGEAFEEILKHREKTLPTPSSGMKPNEDAPNGGKEDSENQKPLDAPDATMKEGEIELQKHENVEKSENSNSNPEAMGPSEEKKKPESGQSSPQDGNQQGDAGERKSKNEIKPDNSTEAGGRSGENRGGNRNGAEEQSNQQGLGRDGSNTPNESGNPAGSGGEGPTGEKGGNSALSDHPTGSADPQQPQGNGSDVKSGGNQSQAYGNSGVKTQKTDNSTTSGGAGVGENVRSPIGTQGLARSSEKEDAVNVDFARKQSVLALEHLRDALDRDDDSLLEYLGWSRDEAREFLEHWEKLNQDLSRESLTPDERREREDAFRSLGLTTRSFRYENRTETESSAPTVRGGRKIEAPQAWREQFDAYSRGIGSGK